MTIIGETIASEIEAAGLPVPGFTIGGTEEDFCIDGKMWADWTAEEQAPYQAIIDVHDATASFLMRASLDKIQQINELRDEKKSLSILSQGYQVDSGDLDVGVMATKIHASSLTGKGIVSITNASGIATATTEKNHHMKTGGDVTISGADQSEYNISSTVTVTGKKTFTYPIAGTPAPATGTLSFQFDTMRFIPTDNSITFVDAAIYREIYLDVEEYIDACQINARILKNAVLQATTVAEIDAVDINAGWPDTGL